MIFGLENNEPVYHSVLKGHSSAQVPFEDYLPN